MAIIKIENFKVPLKNIQVPTRPSIGLVATKFGVNTTLDYGKLTISISS